MNIVEGTVVSLKFPIFKGKYPNSKFVRDVYIKKAVCIREGYGAKAKHWFTFNVIESNDKDYPVGSKKRMQGKNAYPACEILNQPDDIESKTKDKNLRAMLADSRKRQILNEIK